MASEWVAVQALEDKEHRCCLAIIELLFRKYHVIDIKPQTEVTTDKPGES